MHRAVPSFFASSRGCPVVVGGLKSPSPASPRSPPPRAHLTAAIPTPVRGPSALCCVARATPRLKGDSDTRLAQGMRVGGAHPGSNGLLDDTRFPGRYLGVLVTPFCWAEALGRPRWRIKPRFYGRPTLCAHPALLPSLGSLSLLLVPLGILRPSAPSAHGEHLPWLRPQCTRTGRPLGSCWTLTCCLTWRPQVSSSSTVFEASGWTWR